MVRPVFPVTMDNACVSIISTENRATNAKKDFTIFRLAKNATVIRLEL